MERLTESTAAVCGISVAIVLGAALPLHAQGYGLYEQGSCQMGRAGAGVASPCDDGSAIFFNPAGIAVERTGVASVGATGIAPRGMFTNTSTNLVSNINNRVFPSPSAYVAAPVGSWLVVGAGVFAPYGLTTDWPTTAEGRFLGYYSSLRVVYVQPTVAARISDRVMIGAGVDITHTSADLRQRLDLAMLPIPGTPVTFAAVGVPSGTDFADVKITGSANHAGAHVGVLLKPTDRVSFGARFLTGERVSVTDATFTARQIATNLTLRVPLGPTLPAGTPIDRIVASAFAPGAPLSTQTASTSVPLPAQFVAGVAFAPTGRLKVMADYQFAHWEAFDSLIVTPQFGAPQVTLEQYGNTSGVRVGTEYTGGVAIFRAGFDAHNAGSPDQSVTPRLPEAPRWEIAGGVGVPIRGRTRLDLAYQYVHQQDRPGRSGDGPNNGVYDYYANLFSAQLVFRF